MNYKLLGAVLIVIGCGSAGFISVAAYCAEELALKHPLRVIEHMASELKFRLPPLPGLCKTAAEISSGTVRQVWWSMSDLLERKDCADAKECMYAALKCCDKVPPQAKEVFIQLGDSLGRFDCEGQLQGLASAKALCLQKMNRLAENRDVRLRSYCTYGLCAGGAIAILLL